MSSGAAFSNTGDCPCDGDWLRGAALAGGRSLALLVAPVSLAAILGANATGRLADGPALIASLVLVAATILASTRLGWLDGTIARRVTRMGVPVVLGMATQAAVNMVDMYFVGRLPAEVAVPGNAAIGLSLPIFWLVGGFLSAIAVGTQAITARRHSEGNHVQAGSTVFTAAVIATISSIVLSALGYLALPYVLPFFNAQPDVVHQSTTFARIRYIGITSMVVTSAFKGFFDGTGRTYVHLVAAIVMNAANAVLCWLLIPGNLGFPELEVAGAAWAAVLSSVIGTVMMIAWSLGPGNRDKYRIYRAGSWDTNTARTIVRLSIPAGAATIIAMVGFLFFHKAVAAVDVMAGGGSVNASASGAIQQIAMLAFMVTFAYGTATGALVSMSLGAKDPDLATRFGWESAKIGVMAMAGVTALLFIYPEEAMSIFMKSSHGAGQDMQKALVITAGVGPLRLIALSSLVVCAAVIFMQSLYGAGNTRFVMIVEGILHLTCLAPLAWFLGVTMAGGLIGVWSSVTIYAVLLAGILGWKFREGSWKKIEL